MRESRRSGQSYGNPCKAAHPSMDGIEARAREAPNPQISPATRTYLSSQLHCRCPGGSCTNMELYQ